MKLEVIEECKGLQKLIELGIVIKKSENIDNKGFITTYSIKDVLIKHCPVCGRMISNTVVPDSQCHRRLTNESPYYVAEEYRIEL